MKYISSRGEGEMKIVDDIRARAIEYTATMRMAMSDSKYALPEASLRLPFDRALYEKSATLASKLRSESLNYVINIGIGGSSLGAQAVYEALFGVLDRYNPFAPKMLFAESCDQSILSDISEIILNEVEKKEEIIVVIGSKSGTTTETIMNASIMVGALHKKFGSIGDRVVCITEEDSPLWSVGKEQGYSLLPIPKMVGGRYSVFSPVGVFPLLAVGLDMKLLLKGAEEELHDCIDQGVESRAFCAAFDIFEWNKKGINIFDIFLFHPELESFGKWYRQLFAESLGKDTTIEGETTTPLLVPTVSIGSTDLHSMEQMHLAHPRATARTLVRVNAPHWDHNAVVHERAIASLVPGVLDREPRQIMDAIYEGVQKTYDTRGVRYAEIELPDISLQTLGALLQFEMCVVMHLANLLHIDAFNQPNVEEYKNVVREILGKGELKSSE
ncbi:MAG: hypothetical protein HY228_00670 [Candidatus Yonathbacteria bacterium]|nr:hypothetical protein [Candidatus Yonathbacteria bacterium]